MCDSEEAEFESGQSGELPRISLAVLRANDVFQTLPLVPLILGLVNERNGKLS